MTILSPLGKILYTEEDVYKRYHLEVVFSAINQDILEFEQPDHLEEIIDENGITIDNSGRLIHHSV